MKPIKKKKGNIHKNSKMNIGLIKGKVDKATNPISIESEVANNSLVAGAKALTKPYDVDRLEQMVRESTIIPQCIQAYRNNICGFGIGVDYKDEYKKLDSKGKEKPDMEAEYTKLTDIIEMLSIDIPTKTLFEDLVENREIYGHSFIEVINDGQGYPVELNMPDTKTMYILPKDSKLTEYEIKRNNQTFKRKKRFRRFVQIVNSKKIYFKEFGDPRDLDFTTGEYSTDNLPEEKQANAIIHLAVNNFDVYGTPRWEGPMLTIQGAREAELLNWRYFKRGRHTPLMIIVKGGSLSDDSWSKLQAYMNDIEGEKGQHGFLVLEAEKMEAATATDVTDKVEVEIKPLAEILQKDELFQSYLENSRKKAQSSFLLPDIYVGYSQDYNVATAKEATKKTEEQVFQPEREYLEWVLNNILSPYEFKYVKAYFKSPNIENTDHQFRMFSVASKGMTPNQMLTEYYSTMNEDYENSTEPWANVPVGMSSLNALTSNTQTAIEKAAKEKDENILVVLKEVKKALIDLAKKEMDNNV